MKGAEMMTFYSADEEATVKEDVMAWSANVECVTLQAETFGGEDDRSGPAYAAAVRLISFWAMITNCAHALYIKLCHTPRKSLKSILWSLGRSEGHVSSIFFDRFSRINHRAKYGGATWRALEIFYNYYETVEPQLQHWREAMLTRFWGRRLENRQAVRNRLKIVTNMLADLFEQLKAEPEIRLLSVASGSAQAVLDAMKQCPGLNVRVILIDPDTSALEKARQNAEAAGFADRIRCIRGTTRRIQKTAAEFKPHIIEMVGLLDYLDHATAVTVISSIRESLPEGGFFMTCNIHPNREKPFLDWVLLWPMIYRTRREFAGVLLDAGFERHNLRVVYEPLEIHGIALCRRSDD